MRDEAMMEKIVRFLREYVVVFSIIFLIGGLFLFLLGAFWWWARDLVDDAGGLLYFVYTWENWNAYVLVIGLIILGIGVYYLYSFFKKRKFVLEEIKTNKRSELLKKHGELQSAVKHLPSKYKKMLTEKEEELHIS